MSKCALSHTLNSCLGHSLMACNPSHGGIDVCSGSRLIKATCSGTSSTLPCATWGILVCVCPVQTTDDKHCGPTEAGLATTRVSRDSAAEVDLDNDGSSSETFIGFSAVILGFHCLPPATANTKSWQWLMARRSIEEHTLSEGWLLPPLFPSATFHIVHCKMR